jgi:hypothetical protein
MNLPSADQYLQIVEKKALGSFSALQNFHFLFSTEGDKKIYYYDKGLYAVVFKTVYDGNYYAVRFFLDSEPEIFNRYRQIQNYLNSKNLSWKVNFELLEKEVYAQGDYYPVVKMDWIDSLSFTEYLDSIIKNPSAITELQEKLIALSAHLEECGVAHGNLNLKHIRFVKKGQETVLKLIDYDSMFVPAFRGKDSLSPGTAGFQHPMRLASDFSETIDRFSFWIFITALEAFKIDPFLWINAEQRGYDKNEHVLFMYRDLAYPEKSAVFQVLRNYRNENLNFYLDKLIAFCNSNSLNSIEAPQLYKQKRGDSKTLPIGVSSNKDNAFRKETEPVQKPIESKTGQTVLQKPASVHTKEKPIAKHDNGIPHLKVQPRSEEEQELFSKRKKNKKQSKILLLIGVLIVFLIAGYFVWENQSSGINHTTTIEKTSVPQSLPTQKQETVFTSANITQFLFQLYQSYNKRSLQAILTNYADTLHQYYDAGSLTKNKLSDIITNLFIKPAYYECQPDLRTLQFTSQDDSCRLTVSITETIKKDNQSTMENYSSKVEYVINPLFKITAEKNIE